MKHTSQHLVFNDSFLQQKNTIVFMSNSFIKFFKILSFLSWNQSQVILPSWFIQKCSITQQLAQGELLNVT